MSALWAPIGWRGDEEAERTDRDRLLRAVPGAPTRLGGFPFLVVLIAVFGLGMAGLLMLNTTLQNQAFEYRVLKRQATVLAYDEAALQYELDQRSSPGELARQAAALGMRPNPAPAFLVIPGGKIVGKPKPVSGNEVPDLVVGSAVDIAAR